MKLTPQEAEKIKAHLESIRAILAAYKDTSEPFDQIDYLDTACDHMADNLPA